MVSGIIFDMDGVIIDSEDIHKEIELGLLHEHGIEIDREAYVDYTGQPLREIIAAINEERGVNIDIDRYIEARKRRYRDRIEEVQLIPGQKGLIKDLSRQYPVAVATSEERDIAEIVLEQKGIEPFIEALVTASDIEQGKPEPEIFEQAAARLAIDPSHAVVVEDSPNGVTAANAAGCTTIGFLSNPDLDLSAADHTVRDSDELRALLEDLGDAA